MTFKEIKKTFFPNFYLQEIELEIKKDIKKYAVYLANKDFDSIKKS